MKLAASPETIRARVAHRYLVCTDNSGLLCTFLAGPTMSIFSSANTSSRPHSGTVTLSRGHCCVELARDAWRLRS